MSRRIVAGLILLVLTLTACGALPAQGQEPGAQPTELQPPEGEIPVLYPPETGEATAVLFVEDAPVSSVWQQVRGIISELDGWILTSTTSLGNTDGVRYAYVTAAIEVPEFQFAEFVSWIDDLGRLIVFEYSSIPTSDSVSIDLTLTDAAEPFIGGPAPDPQGRVDRALDTAGDVLLTMLSVLIVAGAVILPIGFMAAIAFVVWRWIRRRWPLAELVVQPSEPPVEELIDS